MTYTSNRRLELRHDPLLTEKVVFAIGPQHPSLPAPVQFHVQCDGELVERVTPECGFMHRGVERLCTQRSYSKCAELLSRCEWLAGANTDYLVAAAVEKLAGIEVCERDEWLRMIVLELSRIASHLFWWGQIGLEAGAYTPMFFSLREREHVLDLLELLSGSRYHGQWIVPGGVRNEPSQEFWVRLPKFLEHIAVAIEQYEQFFSDNAIWVNRSELIGVLEVDYAIAHGASGPVLRASGVDCDLRKAQPYLRYSEVQFLVPLGEYNDSLDRYRVRMQEMRESCKIIAQCIDRLAAASSPPDSPVGAMPASSDSPGSREASSRTNESGEQGSPLPINEDKEIPPGETYIAIESPRGELGLTVVSDGTDKPARMHLRSPSLYHLHLMDELCRGYLLADLFVVYGSLDIMVGEVDR